MRRVVAIILLFVMLFAFTPVYAANGFYLVRVNTSVLNVRSAPSTGTHILYQAKQGDLFELLHSETNVKGEKWYRVYDFNKNKVVYIASWLTDNTGIRIQGEDADFKAEVTADVLNVRVGPGTEFPVVDILSKGDTTQIKRIIKRSDGEEWYRYQGKNGQYKYIAGWYTKKVEEPPVKPVPVNKSSRAVALYYINLRRGPSLDDAKIDLIRKGSLLPVVGIARNAQKEVWIEVQYKGKIGWAYSPLFKITSLPSLNLSKIGIKGKISDYVHFRAGPGTNYSVQTTLNPGTSGIVIGVAENENKEIWYELNINNRGWIRSDLINIEKSEKGEINKITWVIAPHGIDVIIKGKSLPNPAISVLENPVRLILNFSNTIVEKESALLINVPPIVRVRYEQDSSAKVTVDLNDRIPFQGEKKDSGTFVLHLRLPKKGEKTIVLSGTSIYVPVTVSDGKEFLSLNDLLNYFGAKLTTNAGNTISINLFGKQVTIDKSKLLKKDNELFISSDLLSKVFNVSIVSTDKTIYIDPVLEEYKKKDSELSFTFSIPTKIKKEKTGTSLYLIFYANPGVYSTLNAEKRNGEISPQIKIMLNAASKNVDITTHINKITVSISNKNEGILAGRIIVIDPGHGSYSGPYLDTGATGPTGVKEGAVVLEIAKRLRKLLEADGAKVILTHETLDDVNNPTLAERCAIANNSGGDLFMSIHLNASVNREAHGTETYYWHSGSYSFAKAIQGALVSNLHTTNRGVKRDYLYVCRNVTTMPAILTEVVFVSNPYEESLCKDPNFLDKVAKALEKGIENYFNEQH